ERKKDTNEHLFYSKSDVFAFQHLFEKPSPSQPVLDMDVNSNYIVQEPLTTPNSESGKDIAKDVQRTGKARRQSIRELTSSPSAVEISKGKFGLAFIGFDLIESRKILEDFVHGARNL
ncbi:hypothetical protein GWI33_009675, partial [Rhynchophorus ferrugineus]